MFDAMNTPQVCEYCLWLTKCYDGMICANIRSGKRAQKVNYTDTCDYWLECKEDRE